MQQLFEPIATLAKFWAPVQSIVTLMRLNARYNFFNQIVIAHPWHKSRYQKVKKDGTLTFHTLKVKTNIFQTVQSVLKQSDQLSIEGCSSDQVVVDNKIWYNKYWEKGWHVYK